MAFKSFNLGPRGDPEVLKMLLGQLKQRIAIALVFFEGISKRSETVRPEPSPNIGDLAHRSS
jgi:hypothetical protein